MSDPITVFLADDQELVRSGFRMLIDAEDDMEVVGEGVDGADTVRQIATLRPDVVLMDIRMPGMDGVEATKQVVALDNGTKVLVLTTFDLDEYVFAALKAGASGFLLKDTRPADLLSAIRAVAAGDSVVAPSATRRLLDHVAPTLPDHVGERRRAPRRAHRPRARGAGGGGQGRHERRDRHEPVHGRGHREDPHRTPAGEVALP